jgi:YHS domain-containing protein
MRHTTMPSLIVLAALAMTGIAFAGGKSEINTNWRGLAINGYDPVAYFEEGRPAKGSGDHELTWKGGTWRFSSREHLERFQGNPETYSPQYGGYCAWAVSQGKTAGIDPDRWKIVDGKLYLNYNKEIQQRWEADIPGFIRKADANWPGVLK